jgi:hypothetical protein
MASEEDALQMAMAASMSGGADGTAGDAGASSTPNTGGASSGTKRDGMISPGTDGDLELAMAMSA